MNVAHDSTGALPLPLASRAIAGVPLRKRLHVVMAGLVPAIHDLSCGTKNVDARDKPGHDEFAAAPAIAIA
ncbi:hypothetical protein [Bradyrhizobium sp. RT6a]|jgi:hypothetical protein|uniref:hypothetical protein n=1 Tax=unclassified Bradyrhizobium TaxID=2631580 RepID=UPI003393AC2A